MLSMIVSRGRDAKDTDKEDLMKTPLLAVSISS